MFLFSFSFYMNIRRFDAAVVVVLLMLLVLHGYGFWFPFYILLSKASYGRVESSIVTHKFALVNVIPYCTLIVVGRRKRKSDLSHSSSKRGP